MLPIQIAIGDVRLNGELNETQCAHALARALPVTAEFAVWGDALHFDVALDAAATRRPDAKVRVGDLCLGAESGTLCIFFGPTPLSPEEEPVSAVPMTVIGKLEGVEALRGAKEAGEITISAGNGRGDTI